MKTLRCVLTAVALVGLPAAVRVQESAPSVRLRPTEASTAEGLYLERCADCHGSGNMPGPNGRTGARPAPALTDVRAQRTAEAVYRAIDDAGIMAAHAKGLTPNDKRRLAE